MIQNHSCFNQLLNLFWQADELSGKSMASYKIIHCIGIPKHKGTTDQFICQFNAFPPFSLLIPCTEQMIGLSTLVIVLNPIKFMFPSDFPVTDQYIFMTTTFNDEEHLITIL